MRLRLVAAFVLLSAAPALAQGCSPPAGMSFDQWFGTCQGALEQAYQMGMGQGAPYQAFVQSMYMTYAQPVQNMGGQMQGDPGSAGNTCEEGSTECFNGYLRTCQPMATGGTWWVTGAQQCDE